MNKSRIVIVTAIVILALCIYWFLNGPAKTFVDNAKDGEVISVLNSYGDAEEKYFASYKEFSSNEERLGFSSKIKGVKAFLSKDLVPTEYLNILPEASFPSVTKDSYRILLAVEKANGRIEFWIIDEKKKPSKLNEFFELK